MDLYAAILVIHCNVKFLRNTVNTVDRKAHSPIHNTPYSSAAKAQECGRFDVPRALFSVSMHRKFRLHPQALGTQCGPRTVKTVDTVLQRPSRATLTHVMKAVHGSDCLSVAVMAYDDTQSCKHCMEPPSITPCVCPCAGAFLPSRTSTSCGSSLAWRRPAACAGDVQREVARLLTKHSGYRSPSEEEVRACECWYHTTGLLRTGHLVNLFFTTPFLGRPLPEPHGELYPKR